jgi:F0F1-type ATP synthase membrane subunit b/b'
MGVSLAVLILAFKMRIIPRIEGILSVRSKHIEGIETEIGRLEEEISNGDSRARVMIEDEARKAAEIVRGAMSEAEKILHKRLDELQKENAEYIKAIEEKFGSCFDSKLYEHTGVVADRILRKIWAKHEA